MFAKDQGARLEPADPARISYAFLRQFGFVLDELSAQGLLLWQDDRHCWCWAWADTAFHSERGFWSIGEALVDAVVMRFPAVFDTQALDEK